MEKQATKTNKIFLFVIAISGWFALVLQFYLIILNRVVSVPETIIRYFSFFTILTNIIVVLYATFILLKPYSRLGKYFSRSNVVTAITVYIVVVGIIYNIILRNLWKPQGWDRVADELLHLVIPVLFLLYWLIFMPKSELKWKNTFPWLIYPLVYFVWVLIFGALSGFYPYPFINVKELGYKMALLNSGILTVGFLLLSLLFVAIDRLMKPQTK